MKVYTIYDKVAGGYQYLMLSVNDQVMGRELSRNTPKEAIFCSNAGDFQLHCVGEYDMDRGKLVGYDVPERVCEMSVLFPQEV